VRQLRPRPAAIWHLDGVAVAIQGRPALADLAVHTTCC
jgi:hypothetical protein